MANYSYVRPTSISECLEYLNEDLNQKLLAGGTDLLVELRDGKHSDLDRVVDVTHIPELKGVEKAEGKLIIKPATAHSTLVRDKIIMECLPVLGAASHTVGSPQIRNAGTIGGSIGTASPASDPTPALIVANGVVTLESKGGETRHELIESFLVKPYKTDLQHGEMITEIIVDDLSGYKTAFVKLGRRKALAIARMNVAVAIQLDSDGKASDVRIVPGSAFPVAKRIEAAEAVLLNQVPTAELIELAGDTVAEEMVKVTGIRWSTEYKKPVIAALVKRALREALEVE